jgi:hypothetical protein
MAFVEAGFRATRQAGFDEPTTAALYRLFASYSFGTLDIELNAYFEAPPVAAQASDTVTAATLARHLPTLAGMGQFVQNTDPLEQFTSGLELLLTAVERLVPPTDAGLHVGAQLAS